MPALTLAQAVTEMGERGFKFLSEARREAMLRDAYSEIAEMQPWPWLLSTTSGAAPLAISDLRTVESVIDTDNQRKLLPEDPRNLTDRVPDLSQAGTPAYYYVEWPSGTPTIRTFPVQAVTLSVRYYKIPATWTSGNEPLLPDQYQTAIVDYAVARGHADGNQFEAAARAREEGGRLVSRMLTNMLTPQADRPIPGQVITGGHGDWT